MRNVILEPEAVGDIESAHDWYEEQLAGLGARFEAVFDQALDWILLNVNLCREIRPGARKYLMRIFPYAVYFKVNEAELRVFAVLHGAQDPGTVSRRLGP